MNVHNTISLLTVGRKNKVSFVCVEEKFPLSVHNPSNITGCRIFSIFAFISLSKCSRRYYGRNVLLY